MSVSREERGSTIVEFALVVSLLMLLFFGIVQYGYQFWALQTASATAREAARRLIVGTDEGCTVDIAKEKASGPHVGPGDIEVVIRYHHQDGSAASGVRGDLVTVTVRLQSLDVGLVPVPHDGLVEESATNRVENIPEDPLDCLSL